MTEFIIKTLYFLPAEEQEFVRFGTVDGTYLTQDVNQAKRFSREEAEEWVHGYEDSYEIVSLVMRMWSGSAKRFRSKICTEGISIASSRNFGNPSPEAVKSFAGVRTTR